ncbi:MAG: hypothetical protein HRT88_10440 [Lentisphaeraceae bacterium]|nr:hypothetical protein [Lentisphaeraceae bacterium]
MKKLTLLILIISIYDLAASLYKAPHSENFTVDASKINDADKIGFTLHLHLYYKLSKQTNYAFAEKSMALSLLLSPKNEAIKVLNTSLIYGLPLGTKTAFSDEELTRRLQADIKNLNTSNNKNNLTLSWYLSDTLKSLTGIEV